MVLIKSIPLGVSPERVKITVVEFGLVIVFVIESAPFE